MSDLESRRDEARDIVAEAYEASVPPLHYMLSGDDDVMTRRRYLIIQALISGAGLFATSEAVASTALEHPEWDMEETKTWKEWEGR